MFVPQAVLTLRGSNGVGFRVWLLILTQPVPGTRALPNTVYMQSKSMSRSSRAGETVPFFKYADFAIAQFNFLGNELNLNAHIPMLDLAAIGSKEKPFVYVSA